MKDTVSFIRSNIRFLAFGFALTFFSSFGQTFFLALFAGEIRSVFNLTHGSWGLIYSIATLASGFTMVRIGALIDRVELRNFAVAVCGGLIISTFGFAAVPMVWLLIPAIYAMRLTGQGLMSHTAMTSMARYFDEKRGRAISVALLGLPAGQAVLPPAAVYLKEVIGWRMTWVAAGVLLTVVLIPLVLRLLHHHKERHEAWVRRTNETNDRAETTRSWTRGEVLRDPRFYLLLPAAVSCAFLLTGIFFHQVHLTESKGWSLQWYALCFSGFSASQAFSTLAAGPLVDRFGARRVVLFFLWPIGLGLVVLATMSAPITALIFLILTGLSAGSSGTLGGALWAELYGTRYIGSIRSMLIAAFVGATAVAPVLMGAMIDRGVTMEAIAWMCFGFVVVSTALAAIGVRRERP